jgi:hypothetical protein
MGKTIRNNSRKQTHIPVTIIITLDTVFFIVHRAVYS